MVGLEFVSYYVSVSISPIYCGLGKSGRWCHYLSWCLLVLNFTTTQLKLFGEHLERVYSMDTFYGDNTLESLLEHSRDLKKGLQDLVSTSEDFFGDAPEEEGIDA